MAFACFHHYCAYKKPPQNLMAQRTTYAKRFANKDRGQSTKMTITASQTWGLGRKIQKLGDGIL
jgi:hypothetical protein